MPDPRFYESLGPASLGELAALACAEPLDPALARVTVQQVAVLTLADPQSVAFVADARHAAALGACAAKACFVARANAARVPAGCIAIVTDLPQVAYARAADRLHRPRRHDAAGPPIHAKANLEADVIIAAGAIVGSGATIGRGTYVGPGAIIGPGVTIGRDSYIGPGVCVGFALIGDGVRIHAGAVLGEPGFGATMGAIGVIDVPQLGRVILQDNVTVGSNSCIDRGAYEDTVVGANTKIDNLVQIAHNVVIGRNCVLAAHTGISGSVVVGDGCQFGGRAGVADHITIGAGARVGAAAGVMTDVPPGESWGGFPARPVKRWLREVAWLARAAQMRSSATK